MKNSLHGGKSELGYVTFWTVLDVIDHNMTYLDDIIILTDTLEEHLKTPWIIY